MIDKSRDALLSGRVLYEQPTRGYRVALEAPLLARFALEGRTRAFASVVDLGAGPGAIVLCLKVMGCVEQATAIEIDRDHAALARTNAALNGVAVEVIEADVAVARARGELVIANPPWFEPDEGAVAPTESRAGARAFTRGTLASFVDAARRCLAPRGRVVLSMPAARLVVTLDALARAGLHPKRLRFVHPREGEEADVVFIEAKPGRPGGLTVASPLWVRGRGDAYTTETAAALSGDWPTMEAWGTAAGAARSSARAGGPGRA